MPKLIHDLVKWLREQIDEDEKVAREASGEGEQWIVQNRYSTQPNLAIFAPQVIYEEGRPSPEHIRHVARHDPARVLRQVEAYRDILNAASTYQGTMLEPFWKTTLGTIASIYADRDGYEQATKG